MQREREVERDTSGAIYRKKLEKTNAGDGQKCQKIHGKAVSGYKFSDP